MDNQEEGDGPDWAATYDGRTPPPHLEDTVVGRLHGEGLLLESATPWRRRSLRVAAAIVLFAAGWGASTMSGFAGAPGAASAATDADASPRVMFVLWEGPGYQPESEPGTRATEYAAWARAVAARGIDISGAELAPERTIFPGGSAEPAELGRIAGYFLLDASDAPLIADLASHHPHVSHGGSIEVAALR